MPDFDLSRLLDPSRLLPGLMLLVTVIFLASGMLGPRHRPLLRWLLFVTYGIAVGLALVLAWRWLAG